MLREELQTERRLRGVTLEWRESLARWHPGVEHPHLARQDRNGGGGGGIIAETLFNGVSQLHHLVHSLGWHVRLDRDSVRRITPSNWSAGHGADAACIAGSALLHVVDGRGAVVCPVDAQFDWVHEEEEGGAGEKTGGGGGGGGERVAKPDVWEVRFEFDDGVTIGAGRGGHTIVNNGKELFRWTPAGHILEEEYERGFADAFARFDRGEGWVELDTPRVIDDMLDAGVRVEGGEYTFDRLVLAPGEQRGASR